MEGIWKFSVTWPLTEVRRQEIICWSFQISVTAKRNYPNWVIARGVQTERSSVTFLTENKLTENVHCIAPKFFMYTTSWFIGIKFVNCWNSCKQRRFNFALFLFDVTSFLNILQEELGWRSCESTRLPPLWAVFDFFTSRDMWTEFVGSLLCSDRFFPRYANFRLSPKNQRMIWFVVISSHLNH